jgi:hypothetical protein
MDADPEVAFVAGQRVILQDAVDEDAHTRIKRNEGERLHDLQDDRATQQPALEADQVAEPTQGGDFLPVSGDNCGMELIKQEVSAVRYRRID